MSPVQRAWALSSLSSSFQVVVRLTDCEPLSLLQGRPCHTDTMRVWCDCVGSSAAVDLWKHRRLGQVVGTW